MKIEIGDTFSITLQKGFGFIQYVGNSDLGNEIVRVLDPVKSILEISESEIEKNERFIIGFPLKSTIKRKIVNKIGTFRLPQNFKIPTKSRSKYIIRGEYKGWHIVDNKTLNREFKKVLSDDDIKLSPSGIFNETLIIKYLEENWKLENWK